MKLTTWKPRMRNDFPNWMDEFFNSHLPNEHSTFRPSVNVKESDDRYTLEVVSPGMKKDDFNLEIENDHIIIRAERKEEMDNEQTENYLRKEFYYQSFERRFLLPDHIDEDKVEASYKDGILSVHLPKTEEVQPKKRMIQVG